MGVFTSKPDLPDLHHVPTPDDVFTMRRNLLAELRQSCLQRWPKVSYTLPEGDEWIIRTRSSENFDASVCCLLTPRLNEWIITNGAPPPKIKAVYFTIVGHNQGWASENDFIGKYVRGSNYDVLKEEPT